MDAPVYIGNRPRRWYGGDTASIQSQLEVKHLFRPLIEHSQDSYSLTHLLVHIQKPILTTAVVLVTVLVIGLVLLIRPTGLGPITYTRQNIRVLVLISVQYKPSPWTMRSSTTWISSLSLWSSLLFFRSFWLLPGNPQSKKEEELLVRQHDALNKPFSPPRFWIQFRQVVWQSRLPWIFWQSYR